MSRYLAVFVLVLSACSADKFPANTECMRLSEANVARDCRGFEAPSGVSFASDSGAFTVEGTMTQAGILVFKDDTDFDRAVTELGKGVKPIRFETARKKRMVLWFSDRATPGEISRVRDVFQK